jgi:hydrogenase maturation protease
MIFLFSLQLKANRTKMKTLILGIGNPILSDDGVGIRVARTLESSLQRPDVTVVEASLAGLDLLEQLAGYDRVIIIDAIQTVGGEVGQIHRLEPPALANTRHASSPHDVNFATALELGKRLGLALPQQIIILAVEVTDVTTFSEHCTTEVEQAIPICVAKVLQELDN